MPTGSCCPAPSTSSDLAWLHAQGLAPAILAHAHAGRPVLGVCGGLQMLGDALVDPDGVDGDAAGLGLLPLTTTFARDKLLRHTAGRFGALDAPWQRAVGRGRGRPRDPPRPHRAHAGRRGVRAVLANADGEPIAWQAGHVFGTTRTASSNRRP